MPLEIIHMLSEEERQLFVMKNKQTDSRVCYFFQIAATQPTGVSEIVYCYPQSGPSGNLISTKYGRRIQESTFLIIRSVFVHLWYHACFCQI